MADQLQLRGGTTSEHSTFTGALREVTVDTDKDTLIVHDAATAGGHPLLREDGSNSALALGSQGTPSLKFTGDTNTGIYSPGADQVAISTGGSGRLFIDSAGNVGVGGTPNAQLNLIAGVPTLRWTDSDTSGYSQILQSDTSLYIDTDRGAAGTGSLIFRTNGTNERLRITSDGKVGLGTSAPSQLLEVHGTAAAGGIGINITNEGDGGAGTVPYAFINARLNPVRNGGEIRFGKEGTYGDAASSDSYMAFYTAVDDVNTERLRIDSNGKLLVGTTSAAQTSSNSLIQAVSSTGGYYIAARNDTSVTTDNAIGGLRFYGNDSDGNYDECARIECLADGTHGDDSKPSRLVFSTTSSGLSSPTERMRITRDSYVRLSSSTGGLQFNGDTAAENALDDYEEGTFVPTITGSTTTGTATYSVQAGRYTKIGRMVHIEIYLTWTGGTGAGDLRISGLPFNASSSPAIYSGPAVNYWNSIPLPANSSTPGALVAAGSNYIYFYGIDTSGNATAVDYDATGGVIVTGSFAV